MKKFFIIILCFSLTASCSYRPILDQNSKYLEVGEEVAQKDIDLCSAKADEYLKQYKAQRAGKEAVRKGVVGAIFGAAFGLIFGNNTKSLLTGLAVGASVGAASGALGVAGEGKVAPDQIKERYVNNCLAKQGYEVIGWQ